LIVSLHLIHTSTGTTFWIPSRPEVPESYDQNKEQEPTRNPIRVQGKEKHDTEQLLQSSIKISVQSDQSSIWDHLYWKRPRTLAEDTIDMGACLSGGAGSSLIPDVDGNEQDFHTRFIEDRVIGEGEFGVVNLVHDMKAPENENAMACKLLRKGVVFKDNIIYTPLRPEILQGEIAMLRALGGEHYCMKLIAVYETSRTIHMVTEYCAGGEMMEYVSKQEEDLRTDDVSRIAFQLLDAVNHCAQHDIVHRDLKPENIMFQSPTPGSDLRIIDFGSGTNIVVEGVHTTFAGSAFYISPEMFQRTYTQKTDIWSIGVTLYVLVAGYPADKLQKTFNHLQQNERDLRQLPNFPDDMPDSFVDLLDCLLIYRHKQRKTAAELLDHEFVKFHQSAFSMEQIALEAQQDTNQPPSRKKMSVSIKGSVNRHTQILDYHKYQRGMTTLIATLLDKKELGQLMAVLDERVNERKEESGKARGMQLGVIPINEMRQIMEDKKHDQV
jgi:serine/threonine protein kinase